MTDETDKLRSITVPGLHHGKNPIPLACRKGPLLVSGGIFGMNAATGDIPADGDAQIVEIFKNIRLIVEAAGGSVEDIVKMTFYTKEQGGKEVLNREWCAMFPDETSRPARHALVYGELKAPILVQCDFMAML